MDKQVKKYQMPFGNFIGKALEDVPLRYLDWLIGRTWVKKKFPQCYNFVVKYLEDPVIKKELEGQLDNES